MTPRCLCTQDYVGSKQAAFACFVCHDGEGWVFSSRHYSLSVTTKPIARAVEYKECLIRLCYIAPTPYGTAYGSINDSGEAEGFNGITACLPACHTVNSCRRGRWLAE